jgi:peroxiredoxin
VGEPFKDFTAETMDGNAFKLSDIKDEYILLEFGSAGCGPCRIFNKTLAKQYDSFKEKMKVVSFSLDVNKEDIIKEAEKDGVSWTLVSDFQGINGKTPIQYRINAIPTFYIISPEGIIVECVFGFSPEFLDKFKKIVEDHKKEKEA